MSELPSITIVTPSYNQEEYLEEALISVIKQDYPNLEYFVMDGGSTDGSVKLFEKYSDNITSWVSEKDDGQSDALHRGFEKGTGEILGWINSDDALFPGALKAVGEFFAANPETDMLLGGIAYADVSGHITKCYTYPVPSKLFAQNGCVAFGQQSMFFRRDMYQKIGGLKLDYHYLMDKDFVYRFIFNNAKIKTTRTMLGIFRWHEDMKSINRTGRKADEIGFLEEEYGYNTKKEWYTGKLFKIKQTLNGNYLHGLRQKKRFQGETIQSIWQKNLEHH